MPSIDTVNKICEVLGSDSRPLLDLLDQGRAQQKLRDPGPRASDGSRLFTRESGESTPAELDGLYNPLRRENLERSVQWALESAPPIPLARQPLPKGDGIYAIYYTGPYDLYRPVASPACAIPLYVGSARTSRPSGGGLRQKLRDHRWTIERCDNLSLADFQVRYLPVEDMFISGAERLMLGDHRPVWNTVVEGFGIHAPGAGRRMAKRSSWDELHPGRPWTTQMAPSAKSAQELRTAVHRHFAATAS